MKKLILLFLVPTLTYASFSKPELIARMNFVNAWNIPDNFWCFSGEPAALKGRIYLSCLDHEGYFMAMWDTNKKYSEVVRAETDHMFSGLSTSFNKVTWFEGDEFSIKRTFEHTSKLKVSKITNLGTSSESRDSFLPLTADSFFFKTKGEKPLLWSWKNNQVSSFFDPEAAYIFSPQIGPKGEIAFKVRTEHLGENAPDKIWLYVKGTWKIVFEDKDSNPSSPWISFRNQLSVDGNKVLIIAKDEKGEALITVENGKTEIIARAGKDLARFDFFNPKLRGKTIAVRGENARGEKVTYVKDSGSFRPLLSQGDLVQTDLGPGRVHYQDQDAIFYGAPGIDEKGNIFLQATLTHPENPRALLGVGLIRFNRE